MNEEAAVYERKRFGSLLKEVRKSRRLSAIDVAVDLYMSVGNLRNIEQGKLYPAWKYYTRLYEYFGGDGFPEYRPIAAGAKTIPVTDKVIDAIDELTKTRTLKKIMRGCKMSKSDNCLYYVMHGVLRVVRRKTLQNIFDYLNWGEIEDKKMGEYPTK